MLSKGKFYKQKKYLKEKGLRLKKELMEKIGDKCECCGENHFELLTLDHIKKDGAKHKKLLGNTHTYVIYQDILDKGKFKDYRMLCFNCNWAYGILGYCPHKTRLTQG